MTLNGAYGHLLVNSFPILGSQTGERAEQYLAAIHKHNQAVFREHEEAADLATIGVYLTGLLSGLMLVWKRTRRVRFLPILISLAIEYPIFTEYVFLFYN